MHFINQKNAWAASEIGAAIAVVMLLLALIVNREKLLEFFNKWWWVILGVFALLGCWTFYAFIGFGFLKDLGHSFIKWMSAGVPMWAIFVAVIIIIVGWWIVRFIVRFLKGGVKVAMTVTPSEVSPETFQPEHYVEDLIFGVWWQWTYSGHTVNIPRPICPDRHCQCDLGFREDWMRLNDGPNMAIIPAPPVSLLCPRCGFKKDFNETKQQVLGSVSTEIVRLIRTGQFRERLANQMAQARQRSN
jgi:hypothetical protein